MKIKQVFSVFILLILTAVMVCGCGSDHEKSREIIYLQAVTSDSVYVMAETKNTDPLTVYYGPTTAYGRSATTESTVSTTGKHIFTGFP